MKVLDFKSALAGIGVFSLALNQISSAVERIGNSLNKAIAPGVAFDTKMHELKAITNATDEQMKLMEDSARRLAKMYGGDAAAGLESFKTILIKLGPELAESLASMISRWKN